MLKIFFLVLMVMLAAVLFHEASAEVYIPAKGYSGYFDHGGVYTVYGFVRNTDSQPVMARVQATVNLGNESYSESQILPVIYQLEDMPFQFKFHEITSGHPALQKPDVSYIATNSRPMDLEINYDRTLIKYPDGHLEGFITNAGNGTVHDINVYALVHDKDNNYLGEVESAWPIASIGPGKKAEFAMYPDPAISRDVYYYSCFVPGADNSVEMSVQRNGKAFYFSVLSIVYFTNQKFVDGNSALSFEASNPWHLPYFANFMFPSNSSKGKFDVFIDGAKTSPLVSLDNVTKNWHVAFNVPYSQHKVIISGFDPGYASEPDKYFYLDARSALADWAGFSNFTISDSKLLEVLGIQGHFVPSWVKKSVGYMINNNVPSGSIVSEIKYLKIEGVVR